jgi:MFS family permease
MSTLSRGLRLPRPAELALSFHLNERHRQFLLRAFLVAVGVRLGLIMAGYIVGYIVIGREGVGAWDVLQETFDRWDANHYERVAEIGYRDNPDDRLFIVFFPLFPLMIRIFHFVIPDYYVAGMAVSFVASIGAGFFLQALVSKDGGDDEEADRALWYMALFPTAYFLAMPYTEALFLMMTTGAFLAARNGRWGWAGSIGMLASLTRFPGILLAPALMLEAFHQNRWRIPWHAVWIGLVPVGFLIYLGINWWVLGDPFEFVEIQRDHWFLGMAWPWEVIDNTIYQIEEYPPGPTRVSIYELRAASMILGSVLLLIGSRWLRPSYTLFGWLSMILLSSGSFQISFPRYLLGIFPLFLVMARLGSRPSVHQTLLTSSAIMMGVLFVVYATNWGF